MSSIAKVSPEASRVDALLPPRLPEFDSSPPSSARGRLLPHVATAVRQDTARLFAGLFVLSDGIFFASLLGMVAVAHASHPEVFSYGRYFLDPRTGLIGTCVLLCGSLTTALAIRSIAHRRKRDLVLALAASCVLAGSFLVLQATEYVDHAERGLLPGRHFLPTEELWETTSFRREHPSAARHAAHFRYEKEQEEVREAKAIGGGIRRVATTRKPLAAELAPLVQTGVLGEKAVYPTFPSQPRNAHLFFGLYFLVGAVHGLHVLASGVAFGWLALRARRGSAHRETIESVDHAALFFNLVVLMRLALFPLFFLIR